MQNEVDSEIIQLISELRCKKCGADMRIEHEDFIEHELIDHNGPLLDFVDYNVKVQSVVGWFCAECGLRTATLYGEFSLNLTPRKVWRNIV